MSSWPAAMVQSVRPWLYRFVRKKNGVIWILTYACVTEWPLRVVRCSLGRLRGLLRMFASLQASKVSTSELRLINFLWQYLSARRAHARTNMGIVCSGHFWQLGSITSLATVPKLKNYFPRGACPLTPLVYLHFNRMQWPYQSRIVGSGP